MSAAQVTALTRQCAELMDAGLSLPVTLAILADSQGAARTKALLTALRLQVVRGLPLSAALRQHPRSFDSAFIRLVRLGEASGQLPTMLAQIAAARERQAAYRAQIRQALTYPAFVCGVASTVITALMIWAVPAFQQLFDGFGAPLPPLTRAALALSRGILRHAPVLALSMTSLAILSTIALHRSPRMRFGLARLSLRVPLLGALLTQMALARWAEGLATLLSAGMPLVEALSVQSGHTGHPVFDRASRELAESITRGDQLAHAMRRLSAFPRTIVSLIAIAEHGGSLDNMLAKLGQRAASDLQRQLASAIRIIEPTVICVCGAFVAILVLSLYLPIIELGNVV